jgi:hypothetical protein
MLAASGLGSNVPPYHLQTAPVLALTGITPDEFKKNLTALVSKTNPAQFSGQYAARQQRGRHPFLVVVLVRDFAVRMDSNCLACVEPLLQTPQFKPPENDPDKTSHRPQRDANVEHQYEGQSGSNKQATGDRNDNS